MKLKEKIESEIMDKIKNFKIKDSKDIEKLKVIYKFIVRLLG